MDESQQELKDLKPEKEFFIGIDSDGCVFDSMEIKHKECFCPNFIKHWKLQAVSKYAREAWEFVNLYSKSRGANRFLALITALDLLRERKEVKARGGEIPKVEELRKWIVEETKLGNVALNAKVSNEPTPEFEQIKRWSDGVNATIADMVHGVPPFPNVREALEKAKEKADMIVISQTPFEALDREWKEHSLYDYIRLIAGQERGTKIEHLQLSAVDKYPKDKILMIGDAFGDYKAAQAAGVLFYPILPGKEEESWLRFNNESLNIYFSGNYAGDYQDKLIKEFTDILSDTPPWLS